MSDKDKAFFLAWGLLAFVIGGVLWAFVDLSVTKAFFGGLGISLLWIALVTDSLNENKD